MSIFACVFIFVCVFIYVFVSVLPYVSEFAGVPIFTYDSHCLFDLRFVSVFVLMSVDA